MLPGSGCVGKGLAIYWFDQGTRPISPDGFNCGAGAQKVARPHPSLFPQEKVQKKSVVCLFDDFCNVKLLTVNGMNRRGQGAVQKQPRQF
jgi:hypothetical protein